MKPKTLRSLIVAVAGALASGQAGAQPVVVGPWGQAPTPLPLPSGSEVLAGPCHGNLTAGAGTLAYQPDTAFWSLGVDSVVARVNGNLTTLTIVPGHYPTFARTGFEKGHKEWGLTDVEGRLEVSDAAALTGQNGLRVNGGGAPAFVQVAVPVDPDSGTGQQGTGTRMKVRVPGGGNDAGLLDPFTTFHAVGFELERPFVALALRRLTLEDYLLRLALSSGDQTEVPLSAGSHRLGLDWSYDGPTETVRARVLVDGRVVTEASGAASNLAASLAGDAPSLREAFGALTEGYERWALDLDDLGVEAGSTLVAGARLVSQADFETWPTDWSRPSPGGPQLDPSAALTGENGARLSFELPEHGASLNTTPRLSPRAGLKIGLRLLEASTVPSEGLTFLSGSSSDNPGSGRSLFELRLVPVEGQLRLEARAGGATAPGCSVELPDTQAHVVELQWAASSERGRDGHLRLWLDGALAGEVNGLANADDRLEALALGVVGDEPGAGAVAIDDLMAWEPTGDGAALDPQAPLR